MTAAILKRSDNSLMAFTGLSFSTIYKLEKTGKFPAHRQLSANRVGWLRSDVEAWMQDLPKAA